MALPVIILTLMEDKRWVIAIASRAVTCLRRSPRPGAAGGQGQRPNAEADGSSTPLRTHSSPSPSRYPITRPAKAMIRRPVNFSRTQQRWEWEAAASSPSALYLHGLLVSNSLSVLRVQTIYITNIIFFSPSQFTRMHNLQLKQLQVANRFQPENSKTKRLYKKNHISSYSSSFSFFALL